MEMLAEFGITGGVANTKSNLHDLQWTVGSGYGYALIREGSILHDGLVTRPIAGVTWTVDSALIVGRTAQRTLPQLVKALQRRFGAMAKLPTAKPVRSVRPSISGKILPLFG